MTGKFRRTYFWLLLFVFLLGLTITSVSARFESPHPGQSAAQPEFAFNSDETLCPPLPAPTGNTVTVSTEAELRNAVNTSPSGTTILLTDGTYNLGQNGYYLWLDTPNVTLRSASGNREAVILDDNYSRTEIVSIAASNVTVADLTIKRAGTHPIHVVSSAGSDTVDTLIYNVHIIDPREQAIKINPGASGYYPDNGEVACSHLELTDEGRPYVNPTSGGCYTGGVDAHQAQGWVIRDNLIEGFWCPNGLSEHGVHMWRGCRDTLVERNVFLNSARGVGFGMMTSGEARTYDDDPCPGVTGYVGHYGGIIRNNFIFANRSELFSSAAGFDSGIAIWQSCNADVLHNTVVSLEPPTTANQGSIEWRFSNTSADIINNLVSHNLVERDGASASLLGNLEDAPLSLFVDGNNGDLHLTGSATAAIDQGVSVAAGLCDDDIDGDTRPIGSARDIGADEYGVPPPSPPSTVTDLRVTTAAAGTSVLNPTLRWTAPTNALTYTLRYSSNLIDNANWDSATTISVPFTASTSGTIEQFTPSISYPGGAVYFALKSQNAAGAWSELSNNAFWPRQEIFLPLVIKSG
jgi:hypothetical protein